MKYIRLSLPDELHARLKALVTHHGHLSHILREAIETYVEREEEKRNPNAKDSKNLFGTTV